MLRDMQVMISFNVNLVVPSGPSCAKVLWCYPVHKLPKPIAW